VRVKDGVRVLSTGFRKVTFVSLEGIVARVEGSR
jgi:hypothetical protein